MPSSTPDQKPSNVLVVDDDKDIVRFLQFVLAKEGYIVGSAFDGQEALEKVKDDPPDLIVLDIVMPRMDGFEVCRRLKNAPNTRLIPVVMITALGELSDKIKAINVGADDFLHKPYEKVELLARVRSLLRVKHLNDELDNAENVIYALARAVEAKDSYTEGHTERASSYATALGRRLGLPEKDIVALHKAGILHDMGKIGVKDAILNKPGPLTDAEFEAIKEHPVRGQRICASLRSIQDAVPIIRWHHERLDGTGYPDGLKEDEIPVTAQLMGIVDVYDALSSDRPYRKALPTEECFEILREEGRKGWRNPEYVEAFIEVVTENAYKQDQVLAPDEGG